MSEYVLETKRDFEALWKCGGPAWSILRFKAGEVHALLGENGRR